MCTAQRPKTIATAVDMSAIFPKPRLKPKSDALFGHPFRRYRRKNGLSQAALAQALGVSGAAITHYELGRRTISAEKAIEFEARLGGAVTRKQLRPDIFGDAAA